jgi:hypothetical protein
MGGTSFFRSPRGATFQIKPPPASPYLKAVPGPTPSRLNRIAAGQKPVNDA